jgi:hypothetical protein
MEKKHILGECSGCKGAGMKKPFVIDSNGPPRPADKYDAPRFMADKAPVGFHVMIKPVGCPIRAYTVFGNFITKDPYCETYKAVFNHMEAVSSAIAMRRSRKKG